MAVDSMEFRVVITGHRPKKLGGYADDNPIRLATKAWITDQLEKLLLAASKGSGKFFDVGTHHVVGISGMALGVDQWFCEVCLDLGVPYDAYIPCEAQYARWNESSTAHWVLLCRQARSRYMVTKSNYTFECMQKRNEAMVVVGHLLLAVWDGSSGGTANCIASAKDAGMSIVQFNPRLVPKE